ncbi:MAG: hypothetical protein EA365_00415 [Gloeocapsa sp. DLM2.Bin57]|nr:MAG: hypothetical protein EA365_00415 [Gloeocapsa sp. DLM2.Bin57]
MGVIFRFTNLAQKPYWEDETLSALRVNGYQVSEIYIQSLRDKIVNRDDLLQLQKPAPDKNLTETISALATHPEHAPLDYLLLRSWVIKVSISVWSMRCLSALISLLVFPALYWLCLELFDSALVGRMAIALTAISPLWIRYAQEVREYSLWGVMIVVCSAALLRAFKLNRWYLWLLYSLTLSLSLYTHILSVLVLIAHGFYVLIIDRNMFNKYLSALLGSLIFFSPWLGIFIYQYQSTKSFASWLNQPVSLSILGKLWGLNLSRMFLSWSPEYNSFLVYLALPILVLIIYALYFLKQTTPIKTWLFIYSLIGVNSLTFLVKDLVFGGQYSRIPQYFFPCYVGLVISIAYLFTNKLTTVQNKVWQVAISLILSSSIFSSGFNAQADTWWGWSEFDVYSAKIINQVSEPLVISDGRLTTLLPLAHQVDSETKFMWIKQFSALNINSGEQTIFIYNPSENLLSYLQEELELELDLIYQFTDMSLKVNLYKVKRNFKPIGFSFDRDRGNCANIKLGETEKKMSRSTITVS